MYKDFDPHKPYFHSVALAFIILGAGFFAVGSVEWFANSYSSYGFAFPAAKVLGGLVVAALGYIHLELELIRISRK